MTELVRPDKKPATAADIAAGHELSDVHVAPLITFLIGLVVATAIVIVLLLGLFGYFTAKAEKRDQQNPPAPLAELREAPPAPHLQESPALDMHMMREQQESRLHRTEWIDEKEGIARIPIEQAMEIVAKEGPPKWPRVETPHQHGEHQHQRTQRGEPAPRRSGKNVEATDRPGVKEEQPSDVVPKQNVRPGKQDGEQKIEKKTRDETPEEESPE